MPLTECSESLPGSASGRDSPRIAVDFERPFLSGTGYRSFLGIHRAAKPGLLPDAFAAEVVADYVRNRLKGRMEAIAERYRN